MRFCSGKARPPPLAVAFQAMIGSSPAALALASRSSNSATVFGGSVIPSCGGELLVVEHARQAVVEAHRIERTGAARAIGPDPVLRELGGRPLVPAEGGRVGVKVLEQSVLDQADHRWEPDQVRRIVARQEPRGGAHQVGELILADLPGHVRELLGELFRELERQVESGLEVGIQLDRIGAAARPDGCCARRRSHAGGRRRCCGRGGCAGCHTGRGTGRGHGARCGASRDKDACEGDGGEARRRRRRLGALE